MAPYVNDDPIFLNLYRELYYRHIYARVQGGPTVEQRLVLLVWKPTNYRHYHSV